MQGWQKEEEPTKGRVGRRGRRKSMRISKRRESSTGQKLLKGSVGLNNEEVPRDLGKCSVSRELG